MIEFLLLVSYLTAFVFVPDGSRASRCALPAGKVTHSRLESAAAAHYVEYSITDCPNAARAPLQQRAIVTRNRPC